MTYVDSTNYEDFDGRYAACPLCRRDNVRLRYDASQVVLDEHPLPMPILAHPAPVDLGARYNPRAAEAKIARVRCPASGEPLVLMEQD